MASARLTLDEKSCGMHGTEVTEAVRAGIVTDAFYELLRLRGVIAPAETAPGQVRGASIVEAKCSQNWRGGLNWTFDLRTNDY